MIRYYSTQTAGVRSNRFVFTGDTFIKKEKKIAIFTTDFTSVQLILNWVRKGLPLFAGFSMTNKSNYGRVLFCRHQRLFLDWNPEP